MTKCSRSDSYGSVGTEGLNKQGRGALQLKTTGLVQAWAVPQSPHHSASCTRHVSLPDLLVEPQRTPEKRGTRLGADSSKVTLPLASQQHGAHLRAPCGRGRGWVRRCDAAGGARALCAEGSAWLRWLETAQKTGLRGSAQRCRSERQKQAQRGAGFTEI